MNQKPELSPARLTIILFVPIIFLLVTTFVIGFNYARQQRQQQSWLTHSYEVINRARAAVADVGQAESAGRALISTKLDYYQNRYSQRRAALTKDLDLLEQSVTDNPSQLRRVQELQSLATERMALMDQSIALGTIPSQSPELMMLYNQGEGVMNRIRSEMAEIFTEEEGLLTVRANATRAAEDRVLYSAIGIGVLTLGAVVFLTGFLGGVYQRLTDSRLVRARQAALLQTTLDSVREGVAVFDVGGELIAFNRNFFALLDFPESLAVPGTLISAFRELELQRQTQIFPELPALASEDFSGYTRIELQGTYLDAYRSALPIGGFLVACADVTLRVQSELAARQSQRMEAVGHLTGGIAHDFNNLLQIIRANLDLLANDIAAGSKAEERVKSAASGVDRASALTRQLLAFARRQPLEPHPVQLSRLVQDMTDLLRRTLGEEIEIETIAGGGLWNAQIDPSQMENAILNLAINARDAMPNGGKLTIEVANAYLDDDYALRHEEVTSGQYVMVAVTDNGSGMPKHVVARAFEPFFSTKPEGKGTGLGLSQVYGFAKQSGGHLKIYSEEGQGTTIKMYFPRTRAVLVDQKQTVFTPAEGGSETILVVEDDAGVRASVVDMLVDLGYRVLQAENAQSALALMKSDRVDVLFTDVIMPGQIKIRDFVREAQALQPDMIVLFTSGYTQNAIVHNGKLDDDVALLSKPYRKDELGRKIRQLLDAPKPSASASASAPSAPASHPKRVVLVVEDEPMIRMAVMDMLDALGCKGLEAGDGKEALALLDAHPDVDVLLTDLRLPGMSGRELSAEARRLKPGLMIVVSSGYDAQDSADGVPNAKHLSKPYELPDLERALFGG